MNQYILSIDQGTTATKVVLYSIDGELKGMSTQRIKQIFPKNGWVEHDPHDLLLSIKKGINSVLNQTGIKQNNIAGIAIDNQGETVIPFDRITSEPLYNAIVWQDSRTSKFCENLKNNVDENIITKKTGLFIDPYFSASKLSWLVNNVDKVRKAVKKGRAILATSDVWLLHMLTGRKSIMTDVTTASRTMLFNINDLKWDQELLELFGISESSLPVVVSSVYDFGVSDAKICEGIEANIYASLVDQQAALFGHTCFYEGEAKITYGTGGFLLLNIGKKRIKLKDKIITTIAAQYDKTINYVLDGGVYCVGSCINWLINELKIISDPSETNESSLRVKNNDGVYFIPSLAGLSTPYWSSNLKGAFFGLSLKTSKNHIIRAVLEGIAFRFLEIIEMIKRNGFHKILSLYVDGGVSKNDFLMQFEADLFGLDIIRPRIKEVTSLGGFFLAGIKLGLWDDIAALKEKIEIEKIFRPKKDNSMYYTNFLVWKKAVESLINWHTGVANLNLGG